MIIILFQVFFLNPELFTLFNLNYSIQHAQDVYKLNEYNKIE